jgi:hypothetical protein
MAADGLSLRAPLPGCGHQGLHPDFFPGTAPAGQAAGRARRVRPLP